MKRTEKSQEKGRQWDILRLAGELFLKQGYYATNIRQIAKELGISVGLISYHYQSKRKLVQTLFSIQHEKENMLIRGYVSQVDDPILYTSVLTKLQMTIFASPVFALLYHEAIQEDIISDVIIDSGLDTFHRINEKYQLGRSDDYLALYGNYNAIAFERILVLYGKSHTFEESIPDIVFKSYMKYLYGDDDLLEGYCRKSDLIVDQILSEHPKLLEGWIALSG